MLWALVYCTFGLCYDLELFQSSQDCLQKMAVVEMSMDIRAQDKDATLSCVKTKGA